MAVAQRRMKLPVRKKVSPLRLSGEAFLGAAVRGARRTKARTATFGHHPGHAQISSSVAVLKANLFTQNSRVVLFSLGTTFVVACWGGLRKRLELHRSCFMFL